MLRVLVVLGSLNPRSTTAVMLRFAADQMSELGAQVDFLDLRTTPLPLYQPGAEVESEHYPDIARRVKAANAYLLGNGTLLAEKRAQDLAATHPSFLAALRRK